MITEEVLIEIVKKDYEVSRKFIADNLLNDDCPLHVFANEMGRLQGRTEVVQELLALLDDANITNSNEQ